MDSEKTAVDTVRVLGIGEWLDFVCGSDSGFGEKPSPGMVQAFCRHTGLDPARVAMIGDSPRDLEMARNAGCGLAVGVLSGAHRESDLEAHADVILPDIVDLPSLLGLEAAG